METKEAEMEFEQRYQAMETRDESYAGRFFAAVTTTGIYCRPGCPARMPKHENVRFYSTAAAARSDGFRACLRCHPDDA
jgi:methylphosphotriester-DNA--protein-cysteine methyltransferase